jgi:hypothetical protein
LDCWVMRQQFCGRSRRARYHAQASPRAFVALRRPPLARDMWTRSTRRAVFAPGLRAEPRASLQVEPVQPPQHKSKAMAKGLAPWEEQERGPMLTWERKIPVVRFADQSGVARQHLRPFAHTLPRPVAPVQWSHPAATQRSVSNKRSDGVLRHSLGSTADEDLHLAEAGAHTVPMAAEKCETCAFSRNGGGVQTRPSPTR